ncbi:MAG: hypothetical protein ONA90_03575 [candidate division KSB1 bacterium]|nr:hypothetical protein [candidate division KSB1 bacterium]
MQTRCLRYIFIVMGVQTYVTIPPVFVTQAVLMKFSPAQARYKPKREGVTSIRPRLAGVIREHALVRKRVRDLDGSRVEYRYEKDNNGQ